MRVGVLEASPDATLIRPLQWGDICSTEFKKNHRPRQCNMRHVLSCCLTPDMCNVGHWAAQWTEQKNMPTLYMCWQFHVTLRKTHTCNDTTNRKGWFWTFLKFVCFWISPFQLTQSKDNKISNRKARVILLYDRAHWSIEGHCACHGYR